MTTKQLLLPYTLKRSRNG